MQHSPEHTPPAAPRRTLRQAFNWRTLKYGSHASLFTVIVLAVVCILYSLALQHNKRFDVTQAKRFTLAEQSIKLLQGLQYSIKVIGFYSLAERDRETFTDLVKQYTQHTDKLSYEVVDPDRQPAMANQYGITMDNRVVVEGNGKKEKISRVEEVTLTNAILKVTRNAKKVVYFVTGHGEPSLTDSDRTGYSLVKQALEDQNYTVQELVLARQPQVPDDAAVVIVAGPRQDLLESETEALSTFLGRGGHLFMMIDVDPRKLDAGPGLVAFVKRYGLEVGNDVVIEMNPVGRLVGADYLMPVVLTYERHAITKELGNVMTIFPVVRSVQVAKELPLGITAQGLVMTSTESWAKTDLKALPEGRLEVGTESDRRGPITIAAVATINPSTSNTSTSMGGSAESTDQPDQAKSAHAARLVVFGDAEFANNNFFPFQGNGNLFLNTVSWLAEEEDLIAIRPRKGGGSGPVMLTAAQAPLIFWLPVVLLPLGVLGSGAVVFVQRKWQQ
jgi:gliding motility-associatede transport system auxiliary component